MPSCTICNNPGAKSCSGCKSTAYCCIECQLTDWPSHKILCKDFRNFPKPPPDRPNARRVIYFPVLTPDGKRATKPILTWLDTELTSSFEMPQHEPFTALPGDTKFSGGMRIEIIRGNKLRAGNHKTHSIQLICRDYVPPKREYLCNLAINAVGGGGWDDYPGPVLATAMAGTDFDPEFYQDIDLVDFRDVVDWFTHWREGHGSATDGIGSLSHFAKKHVMGKLRRNLRGVRANCQADIDAGPRSSLELVSVPARFPLYSLGDEPTSFFEKLDGMPCIMANMTPYKAPSTADASGLDKNPVIEALYTVLDPESPLWGKCDSYWQKRRGSFLVIDRQRNHLHKSFLECFYAFFKDWIRPKMEEAHSLSQREKFLVLLEEEGSKEFSKMLNAVDNANDEEQNDGFRDHFYQQDDTADEWQ